MKLKHLHSLSAALLITGLCCFFYKVYALGYPVTPNVQTAIWTLEAAVSLNVKRGPVKVELFIPRAQPNIFVSDESFISRGFGLATRLEDGNRKAVWSKRKGNGKYHLYYRTIVRLTNLAEEVETDSAQKKNPKLVLPTLLGTQREASEAIIAELYEKSADLDSFVGALLQQLNQENAAEPLHLLAQKVKSPEDRIELVVQLLSLAGIPARAVHGVRLTPVSQSKRMTHWLEVYEKDKWVAFNPNTASRGIGPDYLVWWRGPLPMMRHKGAIFAKVDFSVLHNETDALALLSDQNDGNVSLFHRFSLFSLPLNTQAVYRILLLIPIGAFIVVLFRNIVGFTTFGTFMPVLIALAFRETQLVSGIVMFVVIVGLGLAFRRYFEQLHLLVVPRLAAVLTVVVLLMAALSVVTHLLGLEQGLSIALFPMVILTMVIERMSIIWEETGPGDAIRNGVGTLFIATVAYLVMSINLLGHLVFVFPELLLVVLAITLWLGRYSGYRLLELLRFRELVNSDADS